MKIGKGRKRQNGELKLRSGARANVLEGNYREEGCATSSTEKRNIKVKNGPGTGRRQQLRSGSARIFYPLVRRREKRRGGIKNKNTCRKRGGFPKIGGRSKSSLQEAPIERGLR